MLGVGLKCSKNPEAVVRNCRGRRGDCSFAQLTGEEWPSWGPSTAYHQLCAPKQQRRREASWQALVTVPKEKKNKPRGKKREEKGKNHRATGSQVRPTVLHGHQANHPHQKEGQPLVSNPRSIPGCPSPIVIFPELGEAVTIPDTKQNQTWLWGINHPQDTPRLS